MTDPPIPSPPVTEWDGSDRRRNTAAAAVEQALAKISNGPAGRPTASCVTTTAIIVGSALLALQLLILLSQFRLADRQTLYERNQGAFRDSVVCFIVETYRTAPAAPTGDILTRCGFVTTPRPKD